VIKIDLCKDLPADEQNTCEIMEMDLDDATMCLLNQISEKTGKPIEVVLEDALLNFIETLQDDYTPEL
jgi:antitoxin component of RelBE/YafQ-DinJ toxin-antitoxin module